MFRGSPEPNPSNENSRAENYQPQRALAGTGSSALSRSLRSSVPDLASIGFQELFQFLAGIRRFCVAGFRLLVGMIFVGVVGVIFVGPVVPVFRFWSLAPAVFVRRPAA